MPNKTAGYHFGVESPAIICPNANGQPPRLAGRCERCLAPASWPQQQSVTWAPDVPPIAPAAACGGGDISRAGWIRLARVFRRVGFVATWIIALAANGILDVWNRRVSSRRETPLIALMLLRILGGLGEQGFQMFDQCDRISRRANRLQRPRGFQGGCQFFG